MPPRVVMHVLGRLQRAGTELRMITAMRHIDRSKWQFHFTATTGMKGELDEEVRELGGHVHYVGLDARFPLRFIRVVRNVNASIVHSHVHMASGPVLALAAAAGVRCRIADFRSMGDGRKSSARRTLQRRLFAAMVDQFATNILAVGEGTIASAWSAEWRADPRCEVVYSGIDLSPFRTRREPIAVREEFKLPADRIICSHVGRFDSSKNHLRLIDIFCKVARKNPRATLVLIGHESGSLYERVRARVSALGLDDRVVFAGKRDDVPRLLLASDVMIYPSVREGLPGAVLEACAAGLPVVGSNLPGIAEIAGFFPSVATVGLEEDDEVWASMVANAAPMGAARSLDWSAGDFATTPFAAERAAANLSAVYDAALNHSRS